MRRITDKDRIEDPFFKIAQWTNRYVCGCVWVRTSMWVDYCWYIKKICRNCMIMKEPRKTYSLKSWQNVIHLFYGQMWSLKHGNSLDCYFLDFVCILENSLICSGKNFSMFFLSRQVVAYFQLFRQSWNM